MEDEGRAAAEMSWVRAWRVDSNSALFVTRLAERASRASERVRKKAVSEARGMMSSWEELRGMVGTWVEKINELGMLTKMSSGQARCLDELEGCTRYARAGGK